MLLFVPSPPPSSQSSTKSDDVREAKRKDREKKSEKKSKNGGSEISFSVLAIRCRWKGKLLRDFAVQFKGNTSSKRRKLKKPKLFLKLLKK